MVQAVQALIRPRVVLHDSHVVQTTLRGHGLCKGEEAEAARKGWNEPLCGSSAVWEVSYEVSVSSARCCQVERNMFGIMIVGDSLRGICHAVIDT